MTADLFDLDLDLKLTLSEFGAAPGSVVMLDGDRISPRDRLEYADILDPPSRSRRSAVSAVVEVARRPLLYVVRRTAMGQTVREFEDQVADLRRKLACRGEPAFLAVANSGRLDLHPCDFAPRQTRPHVVMVHDANASSLLRDLAEGVPWHTESLLAPDGAPMSKPTALAAMKWAEGKTAHDILLRSINKVADTLLKSVFLRDRADNAEIILALVGRALLTRFLIDREILTPDTFPDLWTLCSHSAPRSCFDDAVSADLTCRWLDRTFNGDLLPLPVENASYRALFEDLGRSDPSILTTLGCLLYQADRGQLVLPLWGSIDFAHIPVGLLSEVYEDFAHRHSPHAAKRDSVHYTPRHIAELVVSQAFAALTTASPSEATVLDASVGAGVFLTVALRKIYLAQWERNEAVGMPRPGTKEIRSILYEKVRGYDINPGALILAALSLYLTAIELDPDPIPPEKLRFDEALVGTVLFNRSTSSSPDLGSLGTSGEPSFEGGFDIVVGNPPWTSWQGTSGADLAAAAAAAANRIVRRGGAVGGETLLVPEDGFTNPDAVPDLPFLLRSMEWAKADGVIGLVLHARLLFKTTPSSVAARDFLFRHLRITGIINAAALRSVKQVWPGITAQFCILFAYNRPSADHEAFNYVSPFLEEHVNRRGWMRLDPLKTSALTPEALRREPTLLKTLFRGDGLDAALVRKIRGNALYGRQEGCPRLTLGEYLASFQLKGREGIQIGKPETRTRDASAVVALNGKLLRGSDDQGLVVDDQRLPQFKLPLVQWPRMPSIYQPPLLLVREAPRVEEAKPIAGVYLGSGPLVYTDSYTGYSAHGRDVDAGLLLYVATVINSPIFRYFMLMTSSKYGVERDAWNSFEVKSFPIVPFEALTPDVRDAFRLGAAGDAPPDGQELAKPVFAAYGLDDLDLETMRDTLLVGQPSLASVSKAQARPGEEHVERFRRRLEGFLKPMLNLVGADVTVAPTIGVSVRGAGWIFLDVLVDGEPPSGFGEAAVHVADQEGCSIVYDLSGAGTSAKLGLLAQRRFWLPSRASVVGQTLLDLMERRVDR